MNLVVEPAGSGFWTEQSSDWNDVLVADGRPVVMPVYDPATLAVLGFATVEPIASGNPANKSSGALRESRYERVRRAARALFRHRLDLDHPMRHERGQALVEFALVIPLLIVIVAGIFQVGPAWNKKLSLNSAVREAARVASTCRFAASAQASTDAINAAYNAVADDALPGHDQIAPCRRSVRRRRVCNGRQGDRDRNLPAEAEPAGHQRARHHALEHVGDDGRVAGRRPGRNTADERSGTRASAVSSSRSAASRRAVAASASSRRFARPGVG